VVEALAGNATHPTFGPGSKLIDAPTASVTGVDCAVLHVVTGFVEPPHAAKTATAMRSGAR
jgi:hypothetical protein